MRSFKELKVCKKGNELAIAIYKITATFPKEDLCGMVSQLRRTGVSIPANIVKASVRDADWDIARFLHVASGSASEVEYLILQSRDFNWLTDDKYDQINRQVIEIKEILTSFIQALKR